jgi:hypothetical protein
MPGERWETWETKQNGQSMISISADEDEENVFLMMFYVFFGNNAVACI